MLKQPYRGRFAPSPTGALHAGSLATALGSWLHARAHDGIWLIRIEDIDTPRAIKGATEQILRQLAQCGMHSDEPVVYQSKRLDHYQQAFSELQSGQQIYGCRCSRKQVEDALKQQGILRQRHQELMYPGTCREKTDVCEPCAWRLQVNDVQVYNEVGDFVLRRADGIYTYQFAVVVDDYLQDITHVVRGSDLLDNTARQNYLQKQLKYPIPQYLHLPLVLNEQSEKLSKQSGALAIQTESPEQALSALRQAAKHLGLTGDLYSGNLSISDWLAKAVSSARSGLFKAAQ